MPGRTISMAVGALAMSTAVASADRPFGPGTWQSQNGSILTIAAADSASGRLAGDFVTTNSGPGCEANGAHQPIAGWYNWTNHVLTFSVNWTEKGCDSVVAWSGHFDSATGGIKVIWTRVSGLNGSNMNTGVGDFLPLTKP